jgi:hypothetical protein
VQRAKVYFAGADCGLELLNIEAVEFSSSRPPAATTGCWTHECFHSLIPPSKPAIHRQPAAALNALDARNQEAAEVSAGIYFTFAVSALLNTALTASTSAVAIDSELVRSGEPLLTRTVAGAIS